MRKLSSKEIFLAVLFSSLLLVVWIQFKRGAFSGAPLAPDVRAIGKVADAKAFPPPPRVETTDPPAVKIRDHLRNLFNYSRSPDEVAEEERQRREAERLAREAEDRRRKEAEEAARRAQEDAARLASLPPPPPPAPAIPFKFIGKMGSPQTPLAILADATNGDIVVVRQGEVVREQFKVIKIEYDSVTIGYVKAEWTETKTLKMGT